MARTDVVILGGGLEGTAVALICAGADLNVTLLERSRVSRHALGESLPPVVEPLLAQLGVLQPVLDAGFPRSSGTVVAWDGPEFFDPCVDAAGQPTTGLHAWRADLDALLLDQARARGVRVWQPTAAIGPIMSGNRIVGLDTSRGPILGRVVVDATGGRRVLGDWLAIPDEQYGPRRIAWSGLAEGACPARDACPALRGDEHGWTSISRVRPSTYAWTTHNFRNRRPPAGWLPAELAGLTPVGPIRKHDITWRLATQPAGPGFFLTGAAAAVLDPTAAHGVFEGLLTGILAGQLIVETAQNKITAEQAAGRYSRFVRDGFHQNVQEFAAFHRRLATWITTNRHRRSHRNPNHESCPFSEN